MGQALWQIFAHSVPLCGSHPRSTCRWLRSSDYGLKQLETHCLCGSLREPLWLELYAWIGGKGTPNPAPVISIPGTEAKTKHTGALSSILYFYIYIYFFNCEILCKKIQSPGRTCDIILMHLKSKCPGTGERRKMTEMNETTPSYVVKERSCKRYKLHVWLLSSFLIEKYFNTLLESINTRSLRSVFDTPRQWPTRL